MEYEALCKGLELLLDAGAEAVEVFGDSKVAINQSTEDFNCAGDTLLLATEIGRFCIRLESADGLREPSKEEVACFPALAHGPCI